MTPDCRKMLKVLRKIQPKEGGLLLFVEPFDSSEGHFNVMSSSEDIPLPFPTAKTRSILDELESRGLISFPHQSVFTVTHAGWHTNFIAWERFRDFMIKSVLVPIAVSLATSILTVFVLRYIGG